MPKRQLSAILAPPCTLVLLMLVLGIVGLQMLGAGAELLGAHGRWAAAERDAVASLERYARTGDEFAWNGFREALNRQSVPTSVTGLLPPLAGALAQWRQADVELTELRALGDRLRADGTAQSVAALPEIRALHARFVPLDSQLTAELEAAVIRLRNGLFMIFAFSVLSLAALGWQALLLLARYAGPSRLAPAQPVDAAAAPHRAHATLHSIGDAVISADAEERVEFMNAAAERLTGWTLDEARGRPVELVYRHVGEPGEDSPTPAETALAADERRRSGTLVRRDGGTVPIHEHCAPVVDDSGEATGTVRVLRDVTRERAFARELEHQATHDGLTGLVNRNEFERQVAALLPMSEGEQPHALLYFDLDQFKTVNDTCGHTAGDALLRRVAAQMQGRLRSTDTLARMGGDEFCALLRNCPVPQALEVAEGIRAHIAEARFPWQERTFAISSSIGVLALDAGMDNVTDALTAADHACYQSKEAGRNRVRLWRPDDRAQHARQSEVHWLTRLNNALDTQRFKLLGQRLQPLATASSNNLVEVLLRMQDERGQLIAPMAFIPAAERYGLMGRITRWVIEQSCAQLAARKASGDIPCLLINLSSSALADAELPVFVASCLERNALPADRLGFEISETLAITQLNRAIRLMSDLKALGCHTALDDFGGGMSAFVYLRDLKIDYLKIDGNLVRDMTRDPVMYAMVESIHHVARVMGIRTIAKWAEESPLVDALTVIGADYAQGHAVHTPEPLEDCLRNQQRLAQEKNASPDAPRARNSGPLRLVP
jgi:diguanylate cyclase (GGDEF)-like protein/PAS domain S-box-containing protein